MSDSATPWTVARQAPLSTGFSRQEHWSGLPFPPPGDLPDQPSSSHLLHLLAGGFFTTSCTPVISVLHVPGQATLLARAAPDFFLWGHAIPQES